LRGYGSVGALGDAAVKIAECPRYINQIISQLFQNENHEELPEALRSNINTYFSESQHLGLISFFERNKSGEGILLLKDIETGDIIKHWRKLPRAPEAISFFDGTVIVGDEGGEQDSWSSLSKIDKEGNVIWKSKVSAHHLVHVDHTGQIYTPVIMPKHSRANSLLKGRPEYRDDGYAILSPEGHIIQKRSVTEILIDNNLGHLIFGVGPLEWDAIHLNAVKPAEQSSAYWKQGDLLLSLRHLSMVMLYRPSDNKVIWYQLGPWLNQHDPDFLSNSQISIFGNDVVTSFFNRTSETAPFFNSGNEIYIYDFSTNKTLKSYQNITKQIAYKTATAGRLTIFRDGSFFTWYDNQGIGAFYNKKYAQIKYFGCMEDGLLNRESMAVDSYAWEDLKYETGIN